MTTFGDVPLVGEPAPAAQPAQTIKRWMYVWIAIGIVVVLVVVGFLFAIASTLESVDDGLREARDAVAGAHGDVNPLPGYIEDANATLGTIEGSLTDTSNVLVDTSGKLDTISGSLHDTAGVLVDTEGTLGSISGRLVDTEGTLRDTTGTLAGISSRLVDIRALAGRIDSRLVSVESLHSLGTAAIWRRVRFLNGGRFLHAPNPHGLTAIKADADGILAALKAVNVHLDSICRAPAGAAPPPTGTPINVTAPTGQNVTPPC